MRKKGKRRTETNVIQYIENKRLLLYGHVRKSNEDIWINKLTNWNPTGRRKRRRP